MAVFFSCFYAKAARMRVAAGDLGDGRATRRAAGGIMRIRSVRRMGMELFAATRKARRSTRTSVVCIYRLLRQLRRSSFLFVPISLLSFYYTYSFWYYNCIKDKFPNTLPFLRSLFEKLEEEEEKEEEAINQKDCMNVLYYMFNLIVENIEESSKFLFIISAFTYDYFCYPPCATLYTLHITL